MKNIINITWRIFAAATIVFVIVVNGCNSDDPTSTYIPQYENVEEGTAYSSEYWAAVTENSFQVNIPSAGDFKISYTTDRGSSDVLLRLSKKALITVTVEAENVVQEVIVRKGTITVNSSQAIETFTDATFTADESFGTLVLISGGVSTLAKPTVTPTPTAASASALPAVLPTPTDNAKVVVAIGDSITYGQGSSVGGYPTYLEYFLLTNGYDVDVINAGEGGEASPETDSRFSSEISGATAVLLMIGTNDVMGASCSASCTISHISSMLDKALDAGVRPIVSTVIPARSTSYSAAFNNDIVALNSQIRSLASQKGVSYIDSYLLFNKSDAYFSDDIHPNDAGYERIAKEWYWALK